MKLLLIAACILLGVYVLVQDYYRNIEIPNRCDTLLTEQLELDANNQINKADHIADVRLLLGCVDGLQNAR